MRATRCLVRIHLRFVYDHRLILSGKYEFVKKGDPPILGTTKLTPENIKKLMAKKHSGITSPRFPVIAKELANVDVGKAPTEVTPKSTV